MQWLESILKQNIFSTEDLNLKGQLRGSIKDLIRFIASTYSLYDNYITRMKSSTTFNLSLRFLLALV
jgi:hypothetical protein